MRQRTPAQDQPNAPRTHATRLTYQPGIDGLRAISVAAVIAYHLGITAFGGGFLGVEVFFAISGYLITSLLRSEYRSTGRVSMRDFWLRRARRLLPALYALLLAVTIISFVAATDTLGRLRGDVFAAVAYVSNWWQIVHRDSYFVQAGRPSLLAHLWSLAVEEQFYVMWPVLTALLFHRVRRGALALGFVAVAACSTILMAILFTPYHDATRVYVGTDTRLSGLLLGAAMALVWSPDRLRPERTSRAAARVLDGIGVGGLLVLYTCFRHVNEFDPFVFRGGFLIVDIATLAVVAVVVHPSATLGRTLGNPVLTWIGRRSYGLYLWHWPIFVITRPELDLAWPTWAITVLRLTLTVAVTEFSYRYIETPLRHGAIGRWIRELRSTPLYAHPRRRVEAALAVAIPLLAVALLMVAPTQASAHRGTEPPDVALDVTLPPASRPPAATTSSTTSTMRAGPATPAPQTTAVATTVAPPSTAGATSVAAPVPTLPPNSTAIGDSVMAGAAATMRRSIPGMVVDAHKSRQFGEAISQAFALNAAGLLAPVVVVHLGTNGAFSDRQFDQLVDTLGDRRIYFLTTKVPRPWQDIVNARIIAGAHRRTNVQVIDWKGVSEPHPEYFVSDGIHLSVAGIRAYVILLMQSIVG